MRGLKIEGGTRTMPPSLIHQMVRAAPTSLNCHSMDEPGEEFRRVAELNG